jgi:hypothetical protein
MACDITRDAFFVGLVTFANFLPALLLSLAGSAIADHFDREQLLIWLSLEQMAGSLLLAWIALREAPSRPALLGAVAFISGRQPRRSTSYLFLIVPISPVTVSLVTRREDEPVLRRLLGGFSHLRQDPELERRARRRAGRLQRCRSASSTPRSSSTATRARCAGSGPRWRSSASTTCSPTTTCSAPSTPTATRR